MHNPNRRRRSARDAASPCAGAQVGGIEEGSVRPGEKHEVVIDKGSMALFDGKNTFGQTVARDAMNLCIEKVKEHGLAMVSCINTGHVGRVGEYGLMAARAGYVAFCCVNGGAIVAPFGSKGRVLGTNPICCAVPVADGEPLLVDLATSIQAEGKVMSALHKGVEAAIRTRGLVDPSDQLPQATAQERSWIREVRQEQKDSSRYSSTVDGISQT